MSPEAVRTLNFLASMPDVGHSTLITKDVRDVLLETGGRLLACGKLYDIKSKSLGAGVHRVYLEPWEVPE